MQDLGQDPKKSIVESLLFVTKKPISPQEISQVTGFEALEAEKLLDEITSEYEKRPLQVIKVANGYILATRPQYSEFIDKFLNSPVSVTLTRQTLETLSIIAYRQPVTKIEVEKIRGVMSDSPIKSLFEKNLIKEAGRSEAPGRPILYVTTIDFLKQFGLNDLKDLPSIEEELSPVPGMGQNMQEEAAAN